MKKLIVLILLCAAPAFALDWFYPNQQTIAWDSAGNGLTYNVYLCEYSHYESKVLLGNTSEITYVVTVPRDGKQYIVGVTSVMNEYESEINWSDTNGESTPEPFGFMTLAPPMNLRRIEND